MRCSRDCRCCWKEAHICSSAASATRLSVRPALAASRCWRRLSSCAVRSATCDWQLRSRASHSPARAASAGALLQPFLLLGGQALDFVNDGIDLLVQQALRVLQRVELAFVGGNGHFLGAQFGLRLLQAGLQLGLLALQRALAAADFGDLLLQLRPAAARSSAIWFFRPRMEAGALPSPLPLLAAAGVNAVPAQQLAAQGHVVEGAAALPPGGGGGVQVAHDARHAQQALQQRADGSLALDDRHRRAAARHSVRAATGLAAGAARIGSRVGPAHRRDAGRCRSRRSQRRDAGAARSCWR